VSRATSTATRRPLRGRAPKKRLRRATSGDRPFVAALVGLLILLGAMALGPLQSFTAAADRVDALEASRDKLQVEVDRLEDRREQLSDPEELELLARSELGLVKPGEVPFVVVTPPPDVEQVGPEAAEAPAPDDAWYHRLGRALSDLFG
jgi:cell division protein FtsB